MSTQQQDLVFFDDHSLIPERLLTSHSLNIITHEEGTSPTWLVNSLVENCLVGTANSVNRDLVSKVSPRASVTYISFLHSRAFAVKGCRKQGLDLDGVQAFHYIDCFSTLFTKELSCPIDADTHIQNIFDSIEKQLLLQSANSQYVVLFAPEVILAATNIASNTLLYYIQRLNRICNLMTVVASTTESLLDFGSVTNTDPVYKVTDFYVKLHHRSSLNINIMPLATGKATDITGCISVSRGTLPPPNNCRILEKEYAFHVSKEANVKIFYK